MLPMCWQRSVTSGAATRTVKGKDKFKFTFKEKERVVPDRRAGQLRIQELDKDKGTGTAARHR